MSGSIGNSAVFLTDTPKQVQCYCCAGSSNDQSLLLVWHSPDCEHDIACFHSFT